MNVRVIGKLPSGPHLEKLQQSPHYNNGGFQNLSDTPMMAKDASYWKLTRNFFTKTEGKKPSVPLPSVQTKLSELDGNGTVVWFGHSSYLIHIDGKNILVDPVFSGNASPVNFMVTAFEGADVYKVSHMPYIDYLILTHDHYDHLDYKTLLELKTKVGQVYCSLGVGAHLRYWGYDEAVLHEMDWWEERRLNDSMQLTAAPARHFSGRGLKRGKTFWSSFILQTNGLRIYLGGDSGYDAHFAEIGKRFGGFDVALLECGQYNAMWPFIHMMPEETVQAALDLNTRVLMPVHWAKFQLAMHAWNEPAIRVTNRARELGLEVRLPQIGEPVLLNQSFSGTEWWIL